MIEFACSACGRKLRAPATLAGKLVRCRGCADAVTVPAAEAEDIPEIAPISAAVTEEQIYEPELVAEPKRERRAAPDVRKRLPVAVKIVVGVLALVGAVAGYVGGRSTVAWAFAAVSRKTGDMERAAELTEFVPETGGYRVCLPGTPSPLDTAGVGGRARKYLLQRPERNQAFFVLSFEPTGQPASPATLRALVVAEKEHLIKTGKARLDGETQVTLGGLVGHEVRMRYPDGTVLTERLFLLRRGGGSRAVVVGAGGVPGDKTVEAVLASFRLPEEEPPPVIVRPNPKPADPPQPPTGRPTKPKPKREELSDFPIWREAKHSRTRAMAFAGPSTLLARHEGGGLRLRDLQKNTEPNHLVLGAAPAYAFAVSPDGTEFAHSMERPVVIRRKTADLTVVGTCRLIDGLDPVKVAVVALAYSPDGKRFAAALDFAPNRREVGMWDIGSGKRVATTTDLPGVPESLHYLPDGSLAVVGERGVRSFRGTDLGTLRTLGPERGDEAVLSAAVSADGRFAATWCRDRRLRLYRTDDATAVRAWADDVVADADSPPRMALSPDGSLLVCGGREESLRLYDTTTGKGMPFELRGPSGGVELLRFSPDGDKLAMRGDGGFRLLDAAARKAKFGR